MGFPLQKKMLGVRILQNVFKKDLFYYYLCVYVSICVHVRGCRLRSQKRAWDYLDLEVCEYLELVAGNQTSVSPERNKCP